MCVTNLTLSILEDMRVIKLSKCEDVCVTKLTL